MIQPAPPGLPTPPRMSSYTRELLDAATERDRQLVAQTGSYTLHDIRQLVTRMSPAQTEAAVTAALKWAHYWRPENVLHRQELEDIRRAQIAVETSHGISAACGSITPGPTHQQLAVLRATPAWTWPCNRPGCGQYVTVYSKTETVVWCPTHHADAEAGRVAA